VEYYSSLLVQLKGIFKVKGREVTKGAFLHDNAPVHRELATQNKLAYLGFQGLHHPPYSDLSPSDYYLFPGLSNNWKVAIFRPTLRSMLQWRPGWTSSDFFFFLEWLAKVLATG
jgi:hypothetical protein